MGKSSRGWVLDAVEGISNLIAMTSHLRELVTEKLQNDTIEDQEHLEFLYGMVLMERRKLMERFEQRICEDDKHLRCVLKHAIAYYGYAGELHDVTPEFQENMVAATEILNVVLSILTGQPLTFCSRCINDQLESGHNRKPFITTQQTDGMPMMGSTTPDEVQRYLSGHGEDSQPEGSTQKQEG